MTFWNVEDLGTIVKKKQMNYIIRSMLFVTSMGFAHFVGSEGEAIMTTGRNL